MIDAASEVGPVVFFSLLVITVSFLSIFTLESQEGRTFGPLAFTKIFSMAAAAILSCHAGAGFDGGLRARPDHFGAQEPDQSAPDLDLPSRCVFGRAVAPFRFVSREITRSGSGGRHSAFLTIKIEGCADAQCASQGWMGQQIPISFQLRQSRPS